MKRMLCVAQGQVQGVGFRYFIKQLALEYQLTGWIRNMSNGMVEMELQGLTSSLSHVLHQMNRGNQFIQVEDLSCKEIPCNRSESQFQVLD